MSYLEGLQREYNRKTKPRKQREDLETLYEMSGELRTNYFDMRRKWDRFHMHHDFVNLKDRAEEWRKGFDVLGNKGHLVEEWMGWLVELEEEMIKINNYILEERKRILEGREVVE